MLAFFVKNEGNDDVVPDGLHVEANVIAGKLIVGKGLVIAVVSVFIHMWLQSNSVKGGVVYVDGTFVEVGGVEIAAAVESCACEAGVARAIGGFDRDGGELRRRSAAGGYADGWVPSGYRAVNCREKKVRWCSRSQQEICWAAVGDRARRRAGGEDFAVGVRFGNGHYEWVYDSGAVVERAQALAIVGNPPWTSRRAGDPPGIDEIRIGNRGYARSVGHKIHLCVMLGIGE